MAHEMTSLIPRGKRFSAVSTARDTRRDPAVAIKVLPAQVTADPGPRERFDRGRRRRVSSGLSSKMPPHRSPSGKNSRSPRTIMRSQPALPKIQTNVGGARAI